VGDALSSEVFVRRDDASAAVLIFRLDGGDLMVDDLISARPD
jgi:hypothetical protein